ncbi:MAG: hypothetical protein WCX30_02385 [Candidatus Paceibacterota bacterium]|jgi:hypothetical protein|nr:hypothetical protein [bacterium]
MINSTDDQNIGPLEEDMVVEEEKEETAPVSEADILEREKTLEEEKKLLDPVTKFVNYFFKKKSIEKDEREEVAHIEQLSSKKEDAPIKTEKDEIDELVAIALSKGIEVAGNLAKHKSPYVIDAFHDRLIEEMKKGKTDE